MMRLTVLAFFFTVIASSQIITRPGGGSGSGGTVTSISTTGGLGGGTITTSGTLYRNVTTTAHNGAYAISALDWGKIITNNTTTGWTLAAVGSGFSNGFFVDVNNTGSGSFTITVATSPIIGGGTLVSGQVITLPAGINARISSDGSTTFQVQAGGGTGGGSTLVTVDSNGTPVGSPRGTLNIIDGTCMTNTLSDSGTAINIQANFDTAACPQFTTVVQASSPYTVASSNVQVFNNTTGALTINLPPALPSTQICAYNAPTRTGVITLQMSAGDHVAILGVNNTTAGGTITSPGVLGDAYCLSGYGANQWIMTSQTNAWTAN